MSVKIPIEHEGRLTSLGYKIDEPESARHEALESAVDKYGERRVLGMLQAQAVFRKNKDPALSEKFALDRSWVAKHLSVRSL